MYSFLLIFNFPVFYNKKCQCDKQKIDPPKLNIYFNFKQIVFFTMIDLVKYCCK